MSEEKPKIEGDTDTFYITSDNNIFGVAFDKIFEQPLINIHNEFELNSKRNFKNLAPTILATYKELFLVDDEKFDKSCAIIFLTMLNAKSNTMINSPMAFSDFLKLVDTVLDCGDRMLIKKIESYVDDHYALNLDKLTEEARSKNKKVNDMLQFTDEHGKSLIKISYLYRVMIPLISVYYVYNKNYLTKNEPIPDSEDDEDYELDEVNSEIFIHLFDRMAADPEALKNKLYKLAESRVKRTAYSDKSFWNVAKNVSITVDTESFEIYKKIITNVLSKLSIDEEKNLVNFFQTVVNNQIRFLLQNKFKYTMIPVKDNQVPEDDEEISEYERMEIKQARFDEGAFIIRKMNNDYIIKHIAKKFDVQVDDAEVKEATSKITKNQIQERIIALLTFKYFKDKNALKYFNFAQYCYLLLVCKKFLEAKKFIYLPQMLTAKCEKHKERASISGKKIKPEVINSKKYQDLISKKFTFFEKDVENPFLSFVGTAYSSIFKDEEGNEIFDSTVKVSKIADEISSLAEFV